MNATVKIYVPRDSAALAVGANAVAQRIAQEAAARGLAIELAVSYTHLTLPTKA